MNELTDEQAEVLAALLSTYHAALYAFGVLGARLDRAERAFAHDVAVSLRARRDDLVELLRSAGRDVPPPAGAYEVAVTGRADALALAVRVLEALAVRWRDLVAVAAPTDGRAPLRRLGIDGLTEAAVVAANWRALLGIRPPTVAMPGQA